MSVYKSNDSAYSVVSNNLYELLFTTETYSVHNDVYLCRANSNLYVELVDVLQKHRMMPELTGDYKLCLSGAAYLRLSNTQLKLHTDCTLGKLPTISYWRRYLPSQSKSEQLPQAMDLSDMLVRSLDELYCGVELPCIFMPAPAKHDTVPRSNNAFVLTEDTIHIFIGNDAVHEAVKLCSENILGKDADYDN